MLGRMGWAAAVSALGLGPAPGLALSAARTSQRDTAVLAAASGPQTYTGHTSQHQPIGLTIAAGKVKNLHFWIVITCKSHHRYRLHAAGFAPIAIHSGRFQATVSSGHPAASATVAGHLGPGRVSGTLRLRRYVASEHAACSGKATYTVVP